MHWSGAGKRKGEGWNKGRVSCHVMTVVKEEVVARDEGTN